MSKKIDDLLVGAVDLHVHSFPDVSLHTGMEHTNGDVIEACRRAGMAGLVLKAHGWPNESFL